MALGALAVLAVLAFLGILLRKKNLLDLVVPGGLLALAALPALVALVGEWGAPYMALTTNTATRSCRAVSQ